MAVEDKRLREIEKISKNAYSKMVVSAGSDRNVMVSLAILQELKKMNENFNKVSERLDRLEQLSDRLDAVEQANIKQKSGVKLTVNKDLRG